MPDPGAAELIALQQAVIGRYSLERELGRGGMGVVFLARDVALDRLVAIKLLPPAMAAQAGLRERFVREAQMAAKLSHPNIIPIFSVETAGDLVFFVMAYVEGETLGQRLRARGPLPPRLLVRLIQEVAWALAYAHLRGIVHRDIKPDNILIEEGSGRALVSDFGIARAGDSSGATAVGEVLGTAQYMSPEQACGEPVDGRSDLYSLGVVAFFAASGKLPFDAPDIPALLAQHITRPAPPLASVQPGVPRELAACVDTALAKDPAQRHQTGEAMAASLAESVTVSREMPAPIRVWLTKGDGARPALWVWTALVSLTSLVELIEAVVGDGGVDGGGLIALAIPWSVFGLYRWYHTQRAMSAGYGYEDMRRALHQQIERRNEELAFEYDREPSVLAKIVRKLSFAAIGVTAATVGYVWAVTSPDAVLTAWLMGGSSAVAVGGAIVGRVFPGKRLKAKDTSLTYRAKFMDSRVGKWLYRLAGVGVKRGAVSAAVHRPTEVAIGLAAEALFEALPKETRKELKDLPKVVRRLEAEAAATRARVDELDAMLAGPLESGLAAGSASLRHGGGEAASHVAGQHEKLRADLEAQRATVAKRMAASVAALENLRLDLLRLKAGVGSVTELSADLSAARDLQAEIDLAIQSQREVRTLLGEPATPAPGA